MPLGKLRFDEEALVDEFPELDRKVHGAFFTPAPLVQAVLDAVVPLLPSGAPLTVVDPAAGAGAFLAAANERLVGARLFGLELHEDAAQYCRARVTGARILCGDGLREGWDALLSALPDRGFEAWIGNPPYNGTSPLLRDPLAYRALCALFRGELPPGQSLRDDFAFFLLRAARRLESRDGVLAFITPSTLIDGFLYAPVRRALLERLSLCQVLEIGGGAFRGVRVRTCVTVWRSKRKAPAAPACYRTRAMSGPLDPSQLGAPVEFEPVEPDFILRPAPEEATRLDRSWSLEGEPLTTLVPVSLPGLKTRFDELLVDEDPQRLLDRVRDFAATSEDGLREFAAAFGIPARCFQKLAALRASLPEGFEVNRARIRPFYRYAGARHRGAIPESARAFCYLDRALIPRGDHRFRGDWDPHAGAVKLVFNVRELPLSAALLEREGCVHDHRHARFAPLFVPSSQLGALHSGQSDHPVPNLSARGLRWAKELGGPLELFRALVRFINSEDVQRSWAPAFGAVRVLPVNLQALLGARAQT